MEVSRWFRGCCLREERMMAGCRVEVLMGSSGPSGNIAETELTDLDVDEREREESKITVPFLGSLTGWMGLPFVGRGNHGWTATLRGKILSSLWTQDVEGTSKCNNSKETTWREERGLGCWCLDALVLTQSGQTHFLE